MSFIFIQSAPCLLNTAIEFRIHPEGISQDTLSCSKFLFEFSMEPFETEVKKDDSCPTPWRCLFYPERLSKRAFHAVHCKY